jgi:hypothetical protein
MRVLLMGGPLDGGTVETDGVERYTVAGVAPGHISYDWRRVRCECGRETLVGVLMGVQNAEGEAQLPPYGNDFQRRHLEPLRSPQGGLLRRAIRWIGGK